MRALAPAKKGPAGAEAQVLLTRCGTAEQAWRVAQPFGVNLYLGCPTLVARTERAWVCPKISRKPVSGTTWRLLASWTHRTWKWL